MILLNRATDKMQDFGQRNIISYDLVRELEDDEADIRLQIT